MMHERIEALFFRIESQCLRQRIRLARPLHVLRPAQRLQHPLPTTLRTRRALIQHQVQVHIQQPRRMLGALKIPAHPVQTIGNAGKHRHLLYWLSTHVSLLPPPCDEFTTSDPRFSATRVSPPGTIVTLSP